MSAYAWIIDKDHTATPEDGPPGTNKNAKGMMGPRGIEDCLVARLRDGEGEQFRMLDDDGDVYYVGRLIGDAESEDGFGPLDDFGTPNAGCTEIQYKVGPKRVWETL